MKVMAFNGSPRKKWNTVELLEKVLEGAASEGAETELIHIYDIDFKGCTSCFACKTRDGKSYGKCAMKDELTPILEKVLSADAVVVGSPFYFGRITGETASFLERLCFPHLVYSGTPPSIFPRKIKSAMVYAMNVSESMMHDYNYDKHTDLNAMFMERLFGSCENLFSYNTVQTDNDRHMVYGTREEKKAYREATYEATLQNAFDLGKRLTA